MDTVLYFMVLLFGDIGSACERLIKRQEQKNKNEKCTKLITDVSSDRLEDATLQVRKSIVTRVVIIYEFEAPSSTYIIYKYIIRNLHCNVL